MIAKRYYTFALALCCTFLAHSQWGTKLSKETKTLTYNISGFDAIDVSDDFEVTLSFSNTQKPIVVRANENIADNVDVYKKGNTLYLRMKNMSNYSGKLILEASVVAPMVTDYVISGDAVVGVTNEIKASNVSLMVKGDAIFKGAIQTGSLDLIATSDAQVELSGSAENMKAEVRSDSEISSRDFKVDHLNIELYGDSNARIHVTKSLSAEAYGDSTLRYSGNPELIQVKERGDSDIKRI